MSTAIPNILKPSPEAITRKSTPARYAKGSSNPVLTGVRSNEVGAAQGRVERTVEPALPGNLDMQFLLRTKAIQAKLAISQPGDPEEREADRIAEQIVSQKAGATHGGTNGAICSKCEERDKLARKEAVGGSRRIDSAGDAQNAPLRGTGQPLSTSVRDFFEPRFGHDLSQVRVHTYAQAAESANAIHARAFTSGAHIAFASGEFMPESDAGRKLLAHELAHVVRQEKSSTATVSPNGSNMAIFRQASATTGTPGGFDPCFNLLQEIIELLNEVARRIGDALDDPHDLFRYHRRIQDAHPDHGSWDGHRDRYYYDRGRLRQKIAEWESNDNCRGYRFSRQQQEDFNEAKEYADKEFPGKPARVMSEALEEESVWDKLRKYLPEILVGALFAIGAYLAAAAIVGCFASGACEFGLVLAGVGFLLAAGITAALRAAGIRDEPASGPTASSETPEDGGRIS